MAVTDTYVIMNDVDVAQAHVDASKESSLTSYRKSLDDTLAVFKYRGAQPAIFSAMVEYDHAGIKVEMAKVEWKTGE